MNELLNAAIRPMCPACGEVMQVEGMHDSKKTALVSCVMTMCSEKGARYVVEIPTVKAELFHG